MSNRHTFCPDDFMPSGSSGAVQSVLLSRCANLVLISGFPVVYLLIVFLPYFLYLRSKKITPIASSWLNIARMLLALLTATVNIIRCVENVVHFATGSQPYVAFFLSPLFLAISFFCVTFFIFYQKQRGIQASIMTFAFWFFCTVAAGISVASFIVEVNNDALSVTWLEVCLHAIHALLCLVSLVLACIPDQPPPSLKPYTDNKNLCPEEQVNVLSKLTFWWLSSLIVKGYKRILVRTDMWDLSPRDRCSNIYNKFSKQWTSEMVKNDKKNRIASSKKSRSGGKKSNRADVMDENDADKVALHPINGRKHEDETLNDVKKEDGNVPSVDVKSPSKEKKSKSKEDCASLPSLSLALLRAFGGRFLFGGYIKMIHDLLVFISPMILRRLIQFAEDKESPISDGIILAALLLLVATTQSLLLQQYFHLCYVSGLHMKISAMSSVYRKALRLSNLARKESTAGEIVNLMSVDAQRFQDISLYFHILWSGPFQIILCMYFLWQILGASVLAGVGVMILLIPINGFIARVVKNLQVEQMKFKDERIKLMSEILNGIKVLKLYAWEPSYQKRVADIRRKELIMLRRAAYLSALTSFIWVCAPFIVCLVTFAVYVKSSDENILDAQKAFVSLALFNILRFPMSILPMMIASIVQAYVSLQRIRKFLCRQELSGLHSTDTSEPSPDEPKGTILVKDATFCWDKDGHSALDRINLHVKPSQLVAVVGTVGAGKSSLLSALLGELHLAQGSSNVKGSVAYVAQQAWIQNATVRNNILFCTDFERKWYNKVIEACSLRQDLDVFPAHDNTEIGERGINLSGGQKLRVSLARAVYQKADVYLLDDPLSAVDAHVGRHIFDKVIGPNGLLASKTRILVSHGLNFLPQVDCIIVLKDGAVSEVGTFEELMNHAGAFSEFLKEHLLQDQSVEALEDDTKENIIRQLSSVYHQSPEELKRQISEHEEEVRRRVDSSSEPTTTIKEESASADPVNLETPPREEEEDEFDEFRPLLEDEGFISPRKDSFGSALSAISASSVDDADGKAQSPERLVEAETVEVGRVKWVVFFSYVRAMGAIASFLMVFFYALNHVFGVYASIWLSEWSTDPDLLITSANDTVNSDKLDYRLAIYGVLGLAQGICVVIGSLSLAFGVVSAARILHRQLAQNTFRAPMHFFDTTPTGRIVNRFSKDIDAVDTLLPMSVRMTLVCALSVISTLVVIAYTTPIFLLAALPLAIVYAFVQVTTTMTLFCSFAERRVIITAFAYASTTQPPQQSELHQRQSAVSGMRFYVASSRQMKRLESVSRSPIYSHFGETVTGAATIRAFNRVSQFVEKCDSQVDVNTMYVHPSQSANRWLAIRLEFVGNSVIFFAALFAVLGRDAGLSPGLVGLSVAYALNVTQTLNWLVRVTSDLEANAVAVERIKDYSETPSEASWSSDGDHRPDSDWPHKGQIEFRDFSLRYREGLDLVLKNISVLINPNEKIGVVGRTGAGKSSLTLSLFRIIEPASGSIVIDGVDISTIGLHDLRSKLTIIPQDPVLFSGSLRSNLDPFDVHTDEEVWTALEHAHLKDHIKSLPDSLQHTCSEGGENLSVGQRQLLCMARALLRRSRVLILDEATAAVDMETDKLIQGTLRSEFSKCTVVTIAHRIKTVMDYDKILVMDNGEVMEFDSPENLKKDTNSLFYKLSKETAMAES